MRAGHGYRSARIAHRCQAIPFSFRAGQLATIATARQEDAVAPGDLQISKIASVQVMGPVRVKPLRAGVAEVERESLTLLHILEGLGLQPAVGHAEARGGIVIEGPAVPGGIEALEAAQGQALDQPIDHRVEGGDAGQDRQARPPQTRTAVLLEVESLLDHDPHFLCRTSGKPADGHGGQQSPIPTAIAVVAGLALHSAGAARQGRHHLALRLGQQARFHRANQEKITGPLVFIVELAKMFAELVGPASLDIPRGQHVAGRNDNHLQPLSLTVLAQGLNGLAKGRGDDDYPLSSSNSRGRIHSRVSLSQAGHEQQQTDKAQAAHDALQLEQGGGRARDLLTLTSTGNWVKVGRASQPVQEKSGRPGKAVRRRRAAGDPACPADSSGKTLCRTGARSYS